jgi:replicative DNA helicase
MSVGSPQELPYNLEAEQSVLGAILVDPDCLAVAMQYLRPESFFSGRPTGNFRRQ